MSAEVGLSVTQRRYVKYGDAHIAGARELAAAFGAAAQRPLLVVGGPRFDPAAAASLGVDKIFGKGTTPGEVASYLAYALTPALAADSPAGDPPAADPPAGQPADRGPDAGLTGDRGARVGTSA